MEEIIKEQKNNELSKELSPNTKEIINHSKSIFHVQQAGMQCWARSSQMFLSYILSNLGFSKGEIGSIFYYRMLLNKKFIDEQAYENINQYVLGRRLRKDEKISYSFDAMVVKLYDEFGSTAFLAEVFPSAIKHFLQALTSHTKRGKNRTVTLIIDNDEEEEIFEQEGACTIIYKTFSSELKNGLKSGHLSGNDKEFWRNKETKEKIAYLINLVEKSPILIESPGHAFVLSGYDFNEKKFIVNDSLASQPSKISEERLLRSLSAIIMMVKV
jgi:hypothetical protein